MMSRNSLAGVIAWVFLSAANSAWAQDRSYYPGHMMGEGGWIMGPLMMLFFFVILVVFVVLIVRWLWPEHHGDRYSRERERSALTILEERFARGEIDAAEFEEKKRVIGK